MNKIKKNEFLKMAKELDDLKHIKKFRQQDPPKKLHPDTWILFNDIFNKFTNHIRKPFKKIKDSFMKL